MNEVLVALDLEATGMDPSHDQIIEIGAVRFQGNSVLAQFEQKIKPDRPVSLAIQRLTGISNDELREAPRFNDVASELRSFIGRSPIVGQSIDFDLGMLTGSGLRLGNRRYDTFELATILLPQLKTYDLGSIAEALNVEMPDRHRAVADAEISMQVFQNLIGITEDYDEQTLERMAELLQIAESSLAFLFKRLLQERRSESDELSGSSIGSQLLAKLGGSETTGPEAMFLMHRDRPARLELLDYDERIQVEKIEAEMAAGGAFDRTFDHFEERPSQVDMMLAVAENIDYGGQLLIEAGTGTGKSLGYLLPAAMYAMQHGEPVVISTATIALQDQLIDSDIPSLVKAAEDAYQRGDRSTFSSLRHLKATVLKGRANYLCLRQWFLSQRVLPVTKAEAELQTKVIAWLPITETGDRSEIRLTPEQQGHFIKLAEVEGSCLPAQCVFHRRNQCFLFRARQEAEASHLIVVNHSLLLSDQLRGGSVLPAYRHLIVDEAHHLEQETTRQAGFRVSQQYIEQLTARVLNTEEGIGLVGALGTTFKAISTVRDNDVRAAAGELQPVVTAVQELVGDIHRNLQRLFLTLNEFASRFEKDASGYERRIRISSAMRADPSWSQVEIEWDDVAIPVSAMVEHIRTAYSIVSDLSEDQIASLPDILAEFEMLDLEISTMMEHMFGIVGGGNNNLICWFSVHQTTGEMALNAVPLSVADILYDEVYRRMESITFTSATLATESNFGFVRERLGLPDAEELQVASPFDYKESTLLAIADDVPEPNQPGHQKEIHEVLIEACKASEGRAMILFTSHNALQNAYYAIRRPLELEGIVVLGQRLDGSPRQLLERIREQPKTVILGTNSFWEGVDIPGEALSLLVITRLPFSVPSDPVFAARSELFDNPFIEYAVPQSILRFKQGFGRLIRSATDRGVCLVLDRRIISKRYGRAFIDSLPETEQIIGSTNDISQAIHKWLGNPDESSILLEEQPIVEETV